MARRVVLLTGASGLVGTWLRRTLPAGVELVALVHRTAVPGSSYATADLRDAHAVGAVFDRVGPSMVIHAAVAIDAASIVGATEHVVESASRVAADVVFTSTDAVFAGDGRSVDERAQPDPIWDYGRWKLEAERIVLGASTPSSVVRLPLVISLDPEDRGTERIRSGARDGQPTRWFHDEIRQPAMVRDIAEALWRIASLAPDQRAGVWQLPGPESLSRYEIALRVADVLQLDRSSVMSEPTPCDVVRPRHLDMLCDRARAEIGWDPTRILI